MEIKRMLAIALFIISILLSIKFLKSYLNKVIIRENRFKTIQELNMEYNNEIIKQLNRSSNIVNYNVNKEDSNKDSKNVIGKIVIDKLNLDYPILEGSTEENLSITITKFYGSQINCIGNCVLAGHNMKDGSLFGKLSNLSENDKIILYDSLGKKKQYRIFNIKIVSPTDVSVLSQDTNNSCLVTLITCINQGKNRLVLQAK